MTDGQAQPNYANIQAEATRLGARIFTYTLGDGAQKVAAKRLACENGGVYQHVPDCGDLGSAMASYFNVLAAGISKDATARRNPRWVNYFASTNNEEILSGCLPVYKDSGTPGAVAQFLGATCIDLNIIAEIQDLRNMQCWSSFWTRVVNDTETCATIDLTHAEMETLRRQVRPRQPPGCL